jgi:hypothetical protein
MSLKSRVAKLWVAAARKRRSGPLLIEPGWPPLILNSPEYHAAVADGSIEDRIVWEADEPGPKDGIVW